MHVYSDIYSRNRELDLPSMKSVFMSLELDGDTVLDGNVVSQCKMNGEAITTLS